MAKAMKQCTFHLIDNTCLLCPSDSGKDDNIDDGTIK